MDDALLTFGPVSFRRHHEERLESLREADVFSMLFDIMMQEPADSEQVVPVVCSNFREVNLGSIDDRGASEGLHST